MALWLRQSTAVVIHVGPAIATGGLTVVTTLKASTVTAIKIIKHGSLASVAPTSVTGRTFGHKADGHYSLSLLSGDTNALGHFTFYVRASGTTKALPFWQRYLIVPATVYDSLVSSTDKLQADIQQWVGATVTGAVAGKPKVDTLASAAVVWTAAGRLLSSGAVVWSASPRRLSATGIDDVWDEAAAGHGGNDAVGLHIRSLRANTLASGLVGSALLDAGASTVSGTFAGSILYLVSGTGAGQARRIVSYSTGRRAAIAPDWKTTPGATTKYVIGPAGAVTLLSGTHTGAIVPTVSTVSKLLGKVTLATTTHTGAIIPTVSTVSKLLANNDKTGYSLSSAAVVWTAVTRTLTSGLSVASSVWAKTSRTLTSGGNVASSVWGKALSELSAVPAAAPPASQGLMFLYMSARNKRITTATGDKIHNSATTVIIKAPLSASSTTFTKSKYATAT